MNEDEKRSEVDQLTELLIRLRPARAELDSRVVFYEAGFNASQSQRSQPRWGFSALIAATLIGIALAAPLGYRFGRTTATRSMAVRAVPQQHVGATAAKSTQDGASAAQNASTQGDPPPRAESATENDKHAAPHRSLARWGDPLRDLVESAKLEREAGATLTAFHSSLASRGDSRDWMEFPYATTLATYRNALNASPAHGAPRMSPLAASDLQQLTQSMESRR